MKKDQINAVYWQGFLRAAAVATPVVLADPAANMRQIRTAMEKADAESAGLVVFPELGMTGYSLGELFFQESLLWETERRLLELVNASKPWTAVGVVGLPLRRRDTLYNCAAVFHRGRLLGIVPKSFIPRSGEFYEPRYFASGAQSSGTIMLGGEEYPFGTDLIFESEDFPEFRLAVEICEDMWSPRPPSGRASLAGATVIANLSASPAAVGKWRTRELLGRAHSLRTLTGYVYSACGNGESTTDLAWDAPLAIWEGGEVLAVREGFLSEPEEKITADIDLRALQAARLRNGYFVQDEKTSDTSFRRVRFALRPPLKDVGFKRDVARFPFLGADFRDQDLEEMLCLQASALVQRVKSSGAQSLILGVSGGLDSTLALLVCLRACNILGWKREKVVARALPTQVTSGKTMEIAAQLGEAFGVDVGIIEIGSSVALMLEKLGHKAAPAVRRGQLARENPALFDATFENIQAGLRTDFLFRLANQKNGLVIGTGDMSELALGWCTYGVGDQMAHYSINAGVPKTVVREILGKLAEGWEPDDASRGPGFFPLDGKMRRILEEIIHREISPELLPGRGNEALQETESAVGPYALQDFFLYFVLKYGFSPARLFFLAQKAWGETYSISEIKKWMRVFLERFFARSQFKRSAMPNGPKAFSAGSLSPRGDWRAPSDGRADLWLAELEKLPSGKGKVG